MARRVGVSEATVSRVLNGKPGVSDATRESVLTALDVLGYERPTKLRGERARLVGLVIPELQNPIFPAFAEVLGAGLAQNGMTPVLCIQTAGGVSESDFVDLLMQQRVAGVIFAGGLYSQREADHEHYERIRERNLPAVLLNAAIDDLQMPQIVCDDASAMEQAMGHLLALGHQRIGLVLGPAGPRAVGAQAGHRAADRQGRRDRARPRAGRAQPVLAAGRSVGGEQAGRARGHRPGLRERPARARGDPGGPAGPAVACPRTSRSSGYDDSAFMSCTEPPLTTVRQPIEAMGRAAVDLLMRQIGGEDASSDELLFEPELVVRRSTGPVPRPRLTRRPLPAPRPPAPAPPHRAGTTSSR